jgi:outer membrane protein TolC
MKKIWLYGLAALAAGCASLSGDGGFTAVQTASRERMAAEPRWLRSDKEAQEARDRVKELLAAPLSADAAVEVALLNNRGLQAAYAELGIVEADLVQAGRLRNPGFSIGRATRGNDVEVEWTLLFDVLGIATMPWRTEQERRRFTAAKFDAAAATLRLATDTRRAYYRALAAEETVRYAAQVNEAAAAGAELARRMVAVGNFSRLDQAQEQAFYAEATAQLGRARQAALAERERLTRLLGRAAGDPVMRLPDRLPDLPPVVREEADIEKRALERRLDVQARLRSAEAIASSLGLTKATGYLSVLELGYSRVRETGQPVKTGYFVEVRLPVFDWGQAANARAQSTYLQAVNLAADTAVRAQSEVRETYAAYRAGHELARHYREEVVPLRRRISEENLLRYNGMLLSVFDLLADARQQAAVVSASIEALRDFWIAEAELGLAMNGGTP